MIRATIVILVFAMLTGKFPGSADGLGGERMDASKVAGDAAEMAGSRPQRLVI